MLYTGFAPAPYTEVLIVKDFGQQALLDFLAETEAEITQEEALKFFKHSQITSSYRAIASLVNQSKLKRRIYKGNTFYSIGSTTNIVIPEMNSDNPPEIQKRLQIILGIYIKFLSQHRTLPARIRYVDMVRSIISDWQPVALLILCLNSLIHADLSRADVEQLEKQFAAKYGAYDPNRDVWDNLDSAILALQALDVWHTFNDAQRESIKEFDDRRNVFELESE